MRVNDGMVMYKLQEHVLKSNKVATAKIKSVLDDVSYDSNKNFKYLKWKNAAWNQDKKKFNHFINEEYNKRNKEVRSQTTDFLRWKRKRKYGKRWIAEKAFHL